MRLGNGILGISLIWLQWAIQPCRCQAGCSYSLLLEYPIYGQTLTAAATDTGPFTQQFIVSVLEGYSCPGNIIAEATLYANGITDILPFGTIPLNTGFDYVTATYSEITLASLTPQVVEFYLTLSNTADNLILPYSFPVTIEQGNAVTSAAASPTTVVETTPASTIVLTVTPTSSTVVQNPTNTTSATTPTNTGSTSPSIAGPIAGGVVGGLAVFAIAGLLFYFLKRKPNAPVPAFPREEGQIPPSGEEIPEKSTVSSGRALRYLDPSGVQETTSGNLRGNY